MDKQELNETRHLEICLTHWRNRSDEDAEPEERQDERAGLVKSCLTLVQNVGRKKNSSWTLRNNYAVNQGY